METLTIFRRFKLNLSVVNASAEGASEKFGVYYRRTAYDVIIFKFRGGAFAPLPPPADAHVLDYFLLGTIISNKKVIEVEFLLLLCGLRSLL